VLCVVCCSGETDWINLGTFKYQRDGPSFTPTQNNTQYYSSVCFNLSMRIPVLMFGYDIILISLFLRIPKHNLLVQNLCVTNRTVLCGWLSVQFGIKPTGVEVFDTSKITSGTDKSKHPTSEMAAHTHTHTHTHKRIHSLNPSGHYMYRTVVTVCTTSLTFTNATFCPHSVFTVLCTDLRPKSGHIS